MDSNLQCGDSLNREAPKLSIGEEERATSATQRRGSFERRFQSDQYLGSPYTSKLDKINIKQEEELKLATTLLGEMADKVLSRQPAATPSPGTHQSQDSDVQAQVAQGGQEQPDEEHTQEAEDQTSLHSQRAVGTVSEEGTVHTATQSEDDSPKSDSGSGRKKRGRPPRTSKANEEGVKSGGRSRGLAPLSPLDAVPFAYIPSSGDGQTSRRGRGRPRKAGKENTKSGEQEKNQEGEGGEEARRDHIGEESVEDFSGDSPMDDGEEEWEGSDTQTKDLETRGKRVGWRRSSRLMKDAGEEEEDEETWVTKQRANVNTKGDGGEVRSNISRSSRGPDYGSNGEKAGDLPTKGSRGRKRKAEKRTSGRRTKDSIAEEDEDFVAADGLSFARINRMKGTRRNPPRGDGGRGKAGNDDDESDSDNKEQVFCLCRSPADDEFMICCDMCGEWFHGRCVNIGAEEADAIEVYCCPLCQKKSSSAKPEKSSPPRDERRTGSKKAKQSADGESKRSSLEDALSEIEVQVNDEETEAIATLLAATGDMFAERNKRKKQGAKRGSRDKKRPKKEGRGRKKRGSGSDREDESTRKKQRKSSSIAALTHAALALKPDSAANESNAVLLAGHRSNERQWPQSAQAQRGRPPPLAEPPMPIPASLAPMPLGALNNAHVLQLPEGAGVKLWDYFFDKERADFVFNYLYKDVSWRQNKMEFFGGLCNEPRVVACYGNSGLEYRTNGTIHPHIPWTDLLLEIKKRVEDALRCSFNSVFLAKYTSGLDYADWEAENEKTLSAYEHTNTVTLSFGDERPFLLRKKSDAHVNDNECYEVKLQHGAMMLLWGTTLLHYEQAIPKSRSQGTSITMTFRHINSGISLPSTTLTSSAIGQHSYPSHSEPREGTVRPPDFYDGSFPSPPPWVGDIWGRNGEAHNVPVGKIFGSLGELIAAGVHTHTISSVAGSKARGTESVVLSNDGCVRNDNGDVVFFCVSAEIGDGELAGMMLTALERCKSDHGIRLIRSWKVPSSYAPKEDGSYRYDGLYKITSGWMEKSKDGLSDLYAFRLEREKDQPPLPSPNRPVLGDNKEDIEAWRFAKLREFEEEMIRKGLVPRGTPNSSLLASILPRSPSQPHFASSPISPTTAPPSLPPPRPLPTVPDNGSAWNRRPLSPTGPPSIAPKGPTVNAPPGPWYPPSSFLPPGLPSPAAAFHSTAVPPSASALGFPVSYRGSPSPAAPPFMASPTAAPLRQFFPSVTTLSPPTSAAGGSYMKPGNTNIINNINNTINVINNINPNGGAAVGKGDTSEGLSIYLPSPYSSSSSSANNNNNGGPMKKNGQQSTRQSEEIDLTEEHNPKSLS